MVQTFLPYAIFSASASALDNKRLYKQIVEAKQLLLAVFAHDTGYIYYSEYDNSYENVCSYQIRGDKQIFLTSDEKLAIKNKFGKPKKVGWMQHLAAKQWFGYYEALKKYQLVMLKEWLSRTWNVKPYDGTLFDEQDNISSNCVVDYPLWLGLEEYHSSHRARLHQKDAKYYEKFGKDDHGQGYWWPTEHDL